LSFEPSVRPPLETLSNNNNINFNMTSQFTS
jgi:hypothetical protein